MDIEDVLNTNTCPVCGGEVVANQTEKLLRGGVNLATMTVSARDRKS